MMTFVFAVSLAASGDSVSELKAAIESFLAIDSYAYEISSRMAGRDSEEKQGGGQVIQGKYQEGQPILLTRAEVRVFLKGDEMALESKQGPWRLLELEKMKEREGPGEAERKERPDPQNDEQGGSFNREKFLEGMERLARAPLPHLVLKAVSEAPGEVSMEERSGRTTFAGTLDRKALEAVASDMPALQGEGKGTEVSGTFRFEAEGGVLDRLAFTIDVSRVQEEKSVKSSREVLIVVKEHGTAKVECPPEAMRLFSD